MRGDFGLREEVDVVFGEVDAGFEGGDEVDELLLDGGDLAGEGAAELLGGDAGLVEGGGGDEVVDGFGLGEVEAAGEEGALGEFAGFGEAGASGDALAEEVVEEDGGAVGGDLDEVFAGVGVGGGEVGDDGFVECFCLWVEDFGEAGVGGGEGVAELEEGFGDGCGPRGRRGGRCRCRRGRVGWRWRRWFLLCLRRCFRCRSRGFLYVSGEKNYGWRVVVFYRGFCRSGVQNVVFWW